MAYNSDFRHFTTSYDIYKKQDYYDLQLLKAETLQKIADMIQANWRVETKHLTINSMENDYPFLCNSNLPCGITWGNIINTWDGMIVYDFENDICKMLKKYQDNSFMSNTGMDICMPNAQNVIIKFDVGGYYDNYYVITAMQDTITKEFNTFVMGAYYDGNYYNDKREKRSYAVSLNDINEDMKVIEQDRERFEQNYTTTNLTRAMSTNALYSPEHAYISNDTMYFASLDTEPIATEKSVIIDGTEYLGLCFSQGVAYNYNYYFKVESED